MLTLKKKRRSQNLDIVFTEKKPLITKTLFEAFVIAALFHLGLLFIFRIAPLAPFFSETQFPPVKVQADFASINNYAEDALATADLETKNDFFLYPPLPSNPMRISPIVTPVFQPNLSSKKTTISSLDKLTKKFEEQLLFNSDGRTSEDFLFVYGELSKRPYKLGLDFDSSEPIEALYHIKVDNRTGKIFLAKAIVQNETKRAKTQAEKLLKSLRFKPDDTSWISEGYVEIRKI